MLCNHLQVSHYSSNGVTSFFACLFWDQIAITQRASPSRTSTCQCPWEGHGMPQRHRLVESTHMGVSINGGYPHSWIVCKGKSH